MSLRRPGAANQPEWYDPCHRVSRRHILIIGQRLCSLGAVQGSANMGTLTTSGQGGSGNGSAAMRVHSGLTAKVQVPVMFTDKHVRELHPADFKQVPRNRLGKGSCPLRCECLIHASKRNL